MKNDYSRYPSAMLAIPVVVLVAVFAASCWHPTFDPGVSASEITVKKLGAPTLYFSIKDVQQYGMDEAWFLPPMTDMPTSGSLVSDTGGSIDFKQVWIDAFNHSGSISTTSGFNADNAFGDAYLVHSTPNGNAEVFIASDTTTGHYLDWTTNPTTPIPATIGPFGIGAVAQANVNMASLACFVYQGASDPRYTILTWNAGAPAFVAPAAFTFSAASQVAVPGKFLATSIWLYLSCGLTDGSRVIFRWVNPPAASEPAVYPEDFGPLIGALSDGRLLAEENGIISVLDADLNRSFKFPAGKLRFVHERYDNTDVPPRMKTVFTRTLYARYNNEHDTGSLQVEVYEIPTADLANLAD